MKVKVKKDQCIACGYCEGVCSEVFELKDADEGTVSHVLKEEIPDELIDQVMEAIEGCPTSAIEEIN